MSICCKTTRTCHYCLVEPEKHDPKDPEILNLKNVRYGVPMRH